MVKKLTIIFGGGVDFYHKQLNVFNIIEKVNGWKFKRIAPEKLIANVDNIKIEVRFCWNPIRDKIYEDFKSYIQTELKDILAVPASELVEKIKNTDGILFLGMCGAFKGKKNHIYLPNKFKELIFKDSIIKHKHILKIKPKNLISTENFLIGKTLGKESRAVTSNLTLCDKNAEDKSRELIAKLGKILVKHGDFVEKESYQIAKKFKNIYPLGFMIIASDVVSIKKHQMHGKQFKPEENAYWIAENFAKAMKIMVDEVKSK